MEPRLARTPPRLLLVLLVFAPLGLLSITSLADPSAADAADAVSGPAGLDLSSHDYKTKHGVGTADAPVDGKNGKPHEGPWVHQVTNTKSGLETGQGSYGAGDGVMNDRNRPRPDKTGTEGGISEKTRQKPLDKENVPETPREEVLSYLNRDRTDKTGTPDDDDRTVGLEKPAGLPGKVSTTKNPLPQSADKNHLDVSKGSAQRPYTGHGTDDAGDESNNEGIIQPFHSFVLSLAMILVSEIGDKTFLVAALMAMKHDRIVVFSAAFGALLVMTVLSAVLGHAVPTLIPKRVTSFLAAGLFLIFGVRLLREGMAMSPDEGVTAEMQEVEQELQEKEKDALKSNGRPSVSPYSLEMGLGRNRAPRSSSRLPHPPRSPSTSPARSPSPHPGFVAGMGAGFGNLFSLLLSPAWVQTFVMTFLGEWGDRSQIATIAMAAGQDYWWVTLGALVGHACCTSVAVIGGRAIAGKVSMKVVTIGGAIAFLVFGVIYLFEAFWT